MPNSAESERAILGAIILDNALIAEAVERLMPEDFYVPSHRRIFLAMAELFSHGSEINPILVSEELRRDGSLESVGGLTFITNLTYGLPHFANIAHYADLVSDKSRIRQLIKACSKSVSESLEEEETADVLIDHAEQMIFALRDRGSQESLARIDALADQRLEQAQVRQDGGKPTLGVPTGYDDLDTMTAGMQKQNLIILAARPAMGKSALGLNICSNAAESGFTCAYFSLEMSKAELTDRLLCSMSRVDMHRFRSGFLSKDEWSRLATARGQLQDTPLFIDDTASLTVMKLRAKARRIAAQAKRLDLIVVDYLQLMCAQKAESRFQEVSQVARELKGVAKELDVPLLVLSQLSRAPEQRADHRPILSDLRETGEIEQSADIVAFIYREEYYNRTEENAGIAEIIIGKQRNGRTGSVKLAFINEFTRFDNMWRTYA